MTFESARKNACGTRTRAAARPHGRTALSLAGAAPRGPPCALRAPPRQAQLEEIILRAIERSPRSRYQSAAEMLEDLQDPWRVQLTGRAKRLYPRSLRVQRVRRAIWVAVFFSALAAIFVLLIWLANRYPAVPARTGQPLHGEVK